MEVNELNQDQYIDLFAPTTTDPLKQEENNIAKFGAESTSVDLFAEKPEEKKAEDEKSEEKHEGDEEKQVDLLGTGDTKPGRKPKYAFEDAVGYFEDRLKTGKFVKVTTEDAEGKEIDFIPKTPEEFDEVVEININYRVDAAKKELESNWYKDKPAAWQAVAKYAELVDSPADLIPFIQGVQTIESVSQVDENEISGAETIVRTRLAQRGESEDLIEDQIELLKTTNKLIDTAKKYKPLIINDEKIYLSELKRNEDVRTEQARQLFLEVKKSAIKAIDSPIFGTQNLKREEKEIIYDLIAEPDQQSKGYKIYNLIDSLFEKGDFETLKQIALLGTKKESFLNYISIDAKNKVASSLERKIRVASENRGSSNLDSESDQVKVPRKQFTNAPKFGR